MIEGVSVSENDTCDYIKLINFFQINKGFDLSVSVSMLQRIEYSLYHIYHKRFIALQWWNDLKMMNKRYSD